MGRQIFKSLDCAEMYLSDGPTSNPFALNSLYCNNYNGCVQNVSQQDDNVTLTRCSKPSTFAV